MIDIHSHIINGIDDGAKSEDMTIEMLKLASNSATTKIIATPHYFPGRFEVTYKEVMEKVEELKRYITDNNLKLEVYGGQEVYFTSNIVKEYTEGDIGTINNSRYMLIEFPMRGFDIEEVTSVLYELQLKKIVPIIAHPERYTQFIKEPNEINKLIEEGYLFQLNAGSLTGEFGKDVKKTAEIFLENNIYNFIGSDAHRVDSRNTNINEGIDILDNKYEKSLLRFEVSGEALLNNEDVYFEGSYIKTKKKKGLFGFFK